jgi:hypothetical protein
MEKRASCSFSDSGKETIVMPCVFEAVLVAPVVSSRRSPHNACFKVGEFRAASLPIRDHDPSAAQWGGRDPCAHGNRRRGSRDPLQQPMRFSSDLLAGRLGLPAPVRLVQVRMQVEVEVQIKVRMGWDVMG